MSSESTLRFYTHPSRPEVQLVWAPGTTEAKYLAGSPLFQAWLTRAEAIDALESLTKAVAELRGREQ